MKNYDEQIKIQERLKQHGIFSSSLVPSPYADMIEELLNKIEDIDNELTGYKLSNNSLQKTLDKELISNGNGLQSNETNPGKSEDEPVHATETTASPATGSTTSPDATTSTTEPTA